MSTPQVLTYTTENDRVVECSLCGTTYRFRRLNSWGKNFGLLLVGYIASSITSGLMMQMALHHQDGAARILQAAVLLVTAAAFCMIANDNTKRSNQSERLEADNARLRVTLKILTGKDQ